MIFNLFISQYTDKAVKLSSFLTIGNVYHAARRGFTYSNGPIIHYLSQSSTAHLWTICSTPMCRGIEVENTDLSGHLEMIQYARCSNTAQPGDAED